MKNILVPIIAIMSINIGIANSQENQNPLNFMNEQLSQQLLNLTQAMSSPELVKAQAELLRKHYLALIDAGFNKDEAMRIIVAMASQDKK